ncbi:MAG: glycosyltransferase family 2 protein [Deltaproteobacteria bacterium]|nr:glycosyltransferase family 2 protein [Deltaproteobacteria bacterium]MBW2150046.1 glycosyltransferase family 2 protein [Deltaproteobacteria bacterium]
MASQSKNFPLVTIIIPALNEEKHIQACINSLIEQDYPAERLEILVIDGMSEDRTALLVQALSTPQPMIKLLSNPHRIIPAALNIGIASAEGDIIMRADAHTRYEADYVRRSVKLLQMTEAANVGGVITPVGRGLIGRVIAIAVCSPFGVGNAYYRFASKPMWVDTVAFGCWWKKTLIDIGGFNENYVANEDYELNYRLRASGGKILLDPGLKCRYVSRDSLGKLFRQYFFYGQYKVRMLGEYPESMVPRQAAAPVFVFCLAAAVAISALSSWPLVFLSVAYLAAGVIFCQRTECRRNLVRTPLLLLTYLTIHCAWGTGFWYGMKKFGIPKFHKIRFARLASRPQPAQMQAGR